MITFNAIEAAARTLAGAVVRTPTLKSRVLSGLSGAQLFLKMENLQYTAAFKERGALNKLSALSDDERRRGVIAMSAGNHALGVAYHAQRLGIPATIVMPKGTPFTKVRNTRYFGAEVILSGVSLNEATEHALQLAQSQRLSFVHPYDDPLVIAGQGTIVPELLADVPDIDVLVIPVGGGGLISGCAVAAKTIKPSIEVVGVQSALYPSMIEVVHGVPPERTGGDAVPTIAEGIAVKNPGQLTRQIIARHVHDLLTVSEAEIECAVHMLTNIEKTVVEGAGAAGLAAIFAHPQRFTGRNIGIVICGGNIDPRLLASVLMRGLVRDERMVRLQVAVADAPGALAKVARIIGESEGNIVELNHHRLALNLPIKMTELDLVVETRDSAHIQHIADALGSAGYTARTIGLPTTPERTSSRSDTTAHASCPIVRDLRE